MNRKKIFYIIVILVLITIFLYFQCQQRKKKVSRPHEIAEMPAVMPSEEKPEIPQPDTTIVPPAPPEEKVIPEKEQAARVPEKLAEKADIILPVKEPEEKVPEPVEKQLTAPPEIPGELSVLLEVKAIEAPEIKRERLHEKMKGDIAVVPEDDSTKQAEEKVPEPVEEQLTAPPEIPGEPSVLLEVKAIEAPEIQREKLHEKMKGDIAVVPEDDSTKQAEEKAPLVIQIDRTADPARRIAILPFDNLTDNAEAVKGILPWIQGRLKEKGFQVVDETITSEVLCRERIRLATDLPRSSSRKIGNILKAGTVLAGTVFAYSTGINPGVGISARLIDIATGHIIWADYASDTGEDFTGLLGLGTITSIHILIPKVVDQLLASFHIERLQAEPESMYKVAVLPFQNLSKDRHAGMVVTHLFLVQLFKNKLFDPVEYGDVRKMFVDLRVRDKGELSYKNLYDLSRAVGAGIILTGTVEDFSEGISDVYPPKVSISARLLDSSKNKIVWFNGLALDGEDKITAFEWGKMHSPDKVASAVIADLVKNMEKTRWH